MGQNLKLSRAKQLAYYRELKTAKMRASRHADAPCFAYLFAMKEIGAIKVGVSNDPLIRIRNLPQFHIVVEDVFDLWRSFAVFVPRRADAMVLEREILRHFSPWKIPAPSGVVSYATCELVCKAPIRASAGGNEEWLNACVYNQVRDFLLCSDRSTPRPAISIAEWDIGLEAGTLQ